MDWVLQGEYLEFMPAEKLAFTWKWNHDPHENPALKVTLRFKGAEHEGTLLTITHEPYDDTPKGQEDRQGHLEGWIHFCMKLAGLRQGIQDSSLMG